MFIQGINHITLATRNLDVSLAFYTDVLKCQLVARWPRGAYLTAGNVWLAIVVDTNCRQAALPEYTHFAFDVLPADFEVAVQRIREAGAIIWQANSSEGDSLYFLDPDGHKLEIHSTRLYDRLLSAQSNPWEGFELLLEPHLLQGTLAP